MTEAEVLQLIQDFIVANGNNEITADVLRPILEEILKQPNLLIGVLSQLQTSDQSNLVNAINEVYGMIGSITDLGVQLHEGTSNPNTTPPSEYNIADFYIQKDLSNNPIQLWQYNGVSWIKQLGASISRLAVDIPFSGSQSIGFDPEVTIVFVGLNEAPLKESEYTIDGTTLTITPTMEIGDVINVRGITL